MWLVSISRNRTGILSRLPARMDSSTPEQGKHQTAGRLPWQSDAPSGYAQSSFPGHPRVEPSRYDKGHVGSFLPSKVGSAPQELPASILAYSQIVMASDCNAISCSSASPVTSKYFCRTGETKRSPKDSRSICSGVGSPSFSRSLSIKSLSVAC